MSKRRQDRRSPNRVTVTSTSAAPPRTGAYDTSSYDRSAPETLSQEKERLEAYWQRNLRLTLTLLAVWFVVGYLLAIVFAPALNAITFLGMPLGFWIAQNGAIYVFVLLILIYALRMNRMDEEFGVDE